MVFYPNAGTPAAGAPVELRVSEDRSGIDFQLQPVRTARVSGTLQGPPDAIGNLLLRLIPAGLEELGQGSEAATTVTTPDGQFAFLDVPAGSYLLDARPYASRAHLSSSSSPPIGRSGDKARAVCSSRVRARMVGSRCAIFQPAIT